MEKACCQSYEIDYKKVVQEIQETLCMHKEEIEKKLQTEHSPFRYIELKAMLNDVNILRECISEMFEYCKKPAQISNDNKVVE